MGRITVSIAIIVGLFTSCSFNNNYSAMENFISHEDSKSAIGFTTDIKIESALHEDFRLKIVLKDLATTRNLTSYLAVRKNESYISKIIVPLDPGKYLLKNISLEKTKKNYYFFNKVVSTEKIPNLKKYNNIKFSEINVVENEIVNFGLIKISNTVNKKRSDIGFYDPLYPVIDNVWNNGAYPLLTISSLEIDGKKLQKMGSNVTVLKNIRYGSPKELLSKVKKYKNSSIFMLTENDNYLFFNDLKNNTIYRVKPVELLKGTFYGVFQPSSNAKIKFMGFCDKVSECSWPDKIWTNTRKNLVGFKSPSLRIYGKITKDEGDAIDLGYYLGKEELVKLDRLFKNLDIRGFVLDSKASTKNKWEYYIKSKMRGSSLEKALLGDLTKCYNEKVRAYDTHFPTDFSVKLRVKSSQYVISEVSKNNLSSYILSSLEECMEGSAVTAKAFLKNFGSNILFYSKSSSFYD